VTGEEGREGACRRGGGALRERRAQSLATAGYKDHVFGDGKIEFVSRTWLLPFRWFAHVERQVGDAGFVGVGEISSINAWRKSFSAFSRLRTPMKMCSSEIKRGTCLQVAEFAGQRIKRVGKGHAELHQRGGVHHVFSVFVGTLWQEGLCDLHAERINAGQIELCFAIGTAFGVM